MKLPPIPLGTIYKKRHSSRKFGKKPLSLKTLSQLLEYGAGINKNETRFYPSAGARYPLEVYLITLNTELPNGLYHYYVKDHSLERLLDIDKKQLKKIFAPDWSLEGGCVIVISAVFKRTTIKYGDRGYKFALFECGHMSQNFYLTSAALGLSCCAVGLFSDVKLNKLLDIDGLSESVLYVMVVGTATS